MDTARYSILFMKHAQGPGDSLRWSPFPAGNVKRENIDPMSAEADLVPPVECVDGRNQ